MAVTIAAVPVKTLTPGVNDTEALVNERFSLAKDYATESFASAQDYLDLLGQIFTTATMPEVDITYAEQELIPDNIWSDLEGQRPEDPNISTSISAVAPNKPAINDIIVPEISIPTFPDLEMGNPSFNFEETPFYSDIADALGVKLLDLIQNGGTGLGAEIEDAIWSRARARQELQNETLYEETEKYFSARGWDLPTGALAGRLQRTQEEIDRNNNQMNYEISIEQARLAQTQTQFSLSAGIQISGQERDYINAVSNRALEAAKTAVQVLINIFTAKVQERIAKLEVIKTEVEITGLQVSAQAEANRSNAAIYSADIDKYRAQVQSELGIIESLARIYTAKLAGYEADTRVAVSMLDGQIKEFLGKVDQERTRTELSLKEAELTLNSYLGALGLNIETTKAGANIASQLAASALSGISASAHLSDTYGRSLSQGYSHSNSVSNSLGVSYNYSGEA